MRRALMFLALAPMAALADEPAAKSTSKVYELRTYVANPGKAEAMHARFRDYTCKLFQSHGMELVGFWTPTDEKDGKKDTLIYLLAFPSREAAKASWAAFGADPEWLKVYKESHKDGVLVGKVDSVYLEPTDYSPAVVTAPGSAGGPRAFELRTYIANPGKFADMHKRFREHTLDLFKSHGMTNVGYFTPMDANRGRETTLTYLLAFPSRAAADASWKAFRDDPEWQKVKAASEPDKVPLAAKVTSIFLEPTDYSPTK